MRMRMRGIVWGMVFAVPMWAAIIWLLVGCAPTPPTHYRSDPNHYPYYHPVEEDHSGFVYGNDPRQNGFVSRDGTMIYGQQDGGVQFIAR